VVPILLQGVLLLPEEGAAAVAVVQMVVAVVPTACIGPRHPQKTKKF